MRVLCLAIVLAILSSVLLIGCSGKEKDPGYGGEVKTAPTGGATNKPGMKSAGGGKGGGSVGIQPE